MREQEKILEHHAEVAGVGRLPGDLAAVDQHPAGIRDLEAGQDPEHGGLARARRPEQGEELGLLDPEIERADRLDPAEALGDRVGLEDRAHGMPPAAPSRSREYHCAGVLPNGNMTCSPNAGRSQSRSYQARMCGRPGRATSSAR